MAARPRRPGAGLLLALVLVVVYLPLSGGQVLFFRDLAHYAWPMRAFVAQSLARGELPVWNPLHGFGFSVLGNPQYGLFYPPHLLFLAGAGPSLLTWFWLAHTLWGGLGASALARAFGARPAGALVAGLAWSLSGFTTGEWSAGMRLPAGAWVPWIAVGLIAVARAALDAGRRAWLRAAALAAAAVAASALFGELFVTVMGLGFGLALAALWVAFARARVGATDGGGGGCRDEGEHGSGHGAGHDGGHGGGHDGGHGGGHDGGHGGGHDGGHDGGHGGGHDGGVVWSRSRLRLAGGLALAVALGVGSAAVTVIPARRIAAGTARASALPPVMAERCSLHPLRAVEMVAPGALGSPTLDYPAADSVGADCLDGRPLVYSVYLGAAVVALALAGLGRGRRAAWGLAGLALLAGLVAAGRHTPLHHGLTLLLPPLALMRHPEKYFVLCVAALAPLAGLGADRVLAGGVSPWRRVLGLVAALLALSVTAGAVPFSAALAAHVREGGLRGAACAAGVLGVIALVRVRPRFAAAALMALVAGDLAAGAVWPLQEAGPRPPSGPPPAAAALLRDHGGAPEPPRLYRSNKLDEAVARFVPAASYAEGERRWLATLAPNTQSVYGIAGVPGYDPAISPAVAELLGWGANLDALRVLGVDYALLPVSNPADPADRRGPGLRPLMDPLPGARLYRVQDALPRAYLAAAADVVDDHAAYRRLLEPDVVAGRRALVAADAAGTGAGASAVAALPAGPPGRAGACAIERFTDTRVEARCQASQPALAVFIEQYDAGWSASVDGAPAPLLRANVVARAVVLPAGAHRVTLDYRAPGLPAGAALSLASLCGLLACAYAGRRVRPLPP